MKKFFGSIFRKRPQLDLSDPEQLILHHVELLKHHDTGNDGFTNFANQFARLFAEYVPDQGQAQNVQGELVRSLDRLAGEYRRNGCMNWDMGFIKFVEFLRGNLSDCEVFSSRRLAQIHQDLELIERNGADEQDSECVRIAFGRLLQCVVEYCDHYPELVAREPDPSNYR